MISLHANYIDSINNTVDSSTDREWGRKGGREGLPDNTLGTFLSLSLQSSQGTASSSLVSRTPQGLLEGRCGKCWQCRYVSTVNCQAAEALETSRTHLSSCPCENLEISFPLFAFSPFVSSDR